MKKLYRRLLSASMATLMLLTVIPLQVFAAPGGTIGTEAVAPNSVVNPVVGGNPSGNPPPNYALTYPVWDGQVATAFGGGDGAEASPWLITSGGELAFFAQQVNGGKDFAGEYVRLTANIDLNGAVWAPIGYDAAKPFKGHFDGGCHEVINFKVAYNSGNATDSQVYYSGFFGYIEGGSVKDFGITAYEIDQPYQYDTVLGGMVAHAEDATITDCYANGEIGATFHESNPLDRADGVLTYRADDFTAKTEIVGYTALGLPNMWAFYTLELTAENPNKQGAIVDLSGISNPSVGLFNISHTSITVVIDGDVTAVKIIGGILEKTSLSITAKENPDYDLYVELQDVNYDSAGITVEGDRNLYLRSSGNGNTLTESIHLPNSLVYLCGDAPLTIVGTDGAAGANGVQASGSVAEQAPTNGEDGHTAVNAATLIVDMNADLKLVGGNGGQGGRGIQGVTGATNNNYYHVRYGYGIFGIQIQNINCYYQAYTGGDGKLGADGGNGGLPLECGTLCVLDGTLQLQHGDGGKGGKGGTGGTGGKGHDFKGGNTGVSYLTCYNPGQGGNGGKGGQGGNGGVSVTADYSFPAYSIEVLPGTDGQAGDAGAAGAAGAGGKGGSANAAANHHSAGDAAGGAPGTIGTPGGVNTLTPSSLSIHTESLETPTPHLSAAFVTAGGFVGTYNSGTRIIRCAAVVNDLQKGDTLHGLYDHNTFVVGQFAGKATGDNADTLSNILTATVAEDGTVSLYSIDAWYGDQQPVEGAPSDAAILQKGTDSKGMSYDNGITADNTVATGRSLWEYSGSADSVTVPGYVYDGRRITPVTKIADYVFNNCGGLKAIDLGDNTVEVGAKILAGCNNLTSITIGKSLTTIPEYTNGQHLFGLVQGPNSNECASLAKYTVRDGNTAFATDSFGVLYAVMEIPFAAGNEYVPVAVVAAPIAADLSGYVFPDHVVSIAPYAFAYNKTVTAVDLSCIMSVGANAFYKATSLTTVKFGKPEEEKTEYVTILDEKIQDGELYVTQIIGDQAFAGCEGLQSVDLESTYITKIGEAAFADCGNRLGVITLGENIAAIGENAFGSLGSGATATQCRWFEVDENNQKYLDMDGVLYRRQNDGTLALMMYPILKTVAINSGEHQTAFVVPEGVTRIDSKAFYLAARLSELTVSEGVTTIGANAFSNSNIEVIHLPDTVTTISDSDTVFQSCGHLKTITVGENNPTYSDNGEGVLFTKNDDGAVDTLVKYPAQKDDVAYTLPDTATAILALAFEGNDKLQHLTVHSAVTVGYRAFGGCSKLASAYFSGDAPSVDFTAFPVYDPAADPLFDPRLIILYSPDHGEDAAWQSLFSSHGCTNCNTVNESGKHNNAGLHFAPYAEEDQTQNGDDHYAFVVQNQQGERLSDIYVELYDSKTDEKLWSNRTLQDGIVTAVDQFDQHGVGLDLNYQKPYRLYVVDNRGQYFPVNNGEFYLDEYTYITYITLHSVPTLTGVNVVHTSKDTEIKIGITNEDNPLGIQCALEPKTVDINSETAKINKFLAETVEINLSCGVDAGYTVTQIALYSGSANDTPVATLAGNAIQNGNPNTRRTIDASFLFCSTYGDVVVPDDQLDLSLLDDEKDVIAVATFCHQETGETKTAKVKLNIHVFTFEPVPIDLPIPNADLELPLPEGIAGLLGLHNLPLLGKDRSVDAAVILSEDTVRYAVEYNRENLKDFGFDQAEDKAVQELWQEWMKKQKLLNAGQNKVKGGFGYSLGGFVELRYKGLDENGQQDIEVSGGLTGSIEFKFEAGTTVTVLYLPIRVEFETTITGEVEIKLVFDREGSILPSDGGVELGFELKSELRAGIGFSFLSIGAYGNVQVGVLFELLPTPSVLEAGGSFDAGLYIKYSGLFVKWKKTVSLLDIFDVPRTWSWVDNPTKSLPVDDPVRELRRRLLDESNYEIAISPSDSEEGGDYAGIAPQMVQVGDLIYIVYHQDMGGAKGYDAYNYQKIVYQTYDPATGDYSQPQVLEDNGLADGAFRLYADQSGVHLVYSQLNKRLTEADVAAINDLNENGAMATYLGATEIKTAVLTDGVFVPAEKALTHDTYYDMHLQIGKVNGHTVAAWVRNEENSMFGTTQQNNLSVWYSAYDGVWSTPAWLATGLGSVTDLAVDDTGILYITDSDNDLSTVEDRVITTLTLGDDLSVTDSADSAQGAYADISVVGDEAVRYETGNLYPVAGEKGYFDAPVAHLPEEYSVLYDADGAVKAILYVANTVYPHEEGEKDGSGANLYGIFYQDDGWGKPIQLTDYGENHYVTAFDGVDRGDSLLLSVLLSETVYPGTEEAYSVNRFQTETLLYPTACVVGEAEVDHAAVVPNTNVTLVLPITNKGYQTLTHIPVTLLRGGNAIAATATLCDEQGKALVGGLRSGDSAYLHVTFNAGAAGDQQHPLSYTLEVGGQTQEVRLWYSDFEVYGKQVLIGDTTHIVVRVANNGYLPADYVLNTYLGDTLIDSRQTGLLAHGESRHFTIPYDPAACGGAGNVNDGSDLLTVRVEAEEERMTANNQIQLNIAADEMKNLVLHQTAATINRSQLEDVALPFAAGTYTLEAITVGGVSMPQSLWSVSGATVVLIAESIAATYGNGNFVLTFHFSNGETQQLDTFTLTVTENCTVQWVVDGTVVDSATYLYGDTPSHDAPVKDADAQYVYTFLGWDKNGDGVADEMGAITSHTTYVAVFAHTVNFYDVVWVVDGVYTAPKAYAYGTIPVYDGIPAKPSDARYDYVFEGWDNEVTAVTGAVTYTALFRAITRQYTVTTIVDGVESTQQVPYGTLPTLSDPVKAADVQYDYTFTGWSPVLSTVYSDQTYTAQFSATLRRYTITWVVEDTVTVEEYAYGEMPSYKGTPTKTGDAQYSYQFDGWDTLVSVVGGHATYTAQFTPVLNRYTVTFDVNGHLTTTQYAYGDVPVYEGEVGHYVDEVNRYRFIGWDKELSAVTGDVTYVAQYAATPLGSGTVTNTAFSAVRGGTFTTTLSLQDAVGMTDATLTIYYNPTLVTPVTYTCHPGVTVTATGDSSLTLLVTALQEGDTRDLLDITFAVSDQAAYGTSDFMAVVAEDHILGDLRVLTLYQPGDVDGNGTVNNRDLGRMQQYLNGWDVVLEPTAADADGNGIINNRDLGWFIRYVNEWEFPRS